MPKQRITKEMILDAAFRLLREGGEDRILVKTIAAELSCSVQPIYSYYENMDALRQELSEMASRILKEYVTERIDKHALFESTGKAYLSFAKEEPHLFKSYFLRRRSGIHSFDDLYKAEANGSMAQYLAETLGISERCAENLHMNLIIFNTGISFMLVSSGGNLPEQELHQKLEDAYRVFLTAAKEEGDLI